MEDRQHTTKECADKLILETILQDKFFYFKSEEGNVAVTTATEFGQNIPQSGACRLRE
mgnify:CR=1 FL=1